MPKVSAIRQWITESGREIDLQVDGGVNAETAKILPGGWRERVGCRFLSFLERGLRRSDSDAGKINQKFSPAFFQKAAGVQRAAPAGRAPQSSKRLIVQAPFEGKIGREKVLLPIGELFVREKVPQLLSFPDSFFSCQKGPDGNPLPKSACTAKVFAPLLLFQSTRKELFLSCPYFSG